MNDFVMIAIAAVVAFVLGVLACILIHRQKAKSDQRKIADAETALSQDQADLAALIEQRNQLKKEADDLAARIAGFHPIRSSRALRQ